MTLFALALLPFLAAFTWATENPAADLDRAESAAAERIQTGILDPILGPGRSSAFARFTLVVKSDGDFSDRGGTGKASRTRQKKGSGGIDDLGKSFDPQAAEKEVSSNNSVAMSTDAVSDDDRLQESHQSVGKTSGRSAVSLEYADFRIIVLHDAGLPADKLEDVRAALVAVYSPDLKAGDIRFQAASFVPK